MEKWVFHKVNSVSPLTNYRLSVHFWEGVTKIYDVKPWFKKQPVFKTLKKNKLFEKVHVDGIGYGIVWNDDVDLACNELWYNGETIKTDFDDILSFADASKMWELSESTLRKAISYGKLVSGIDACKYGKQWVVTRAAMEREYGKPKK